MKFVILAFVLFVAVAAQHGYEHKHLEEYVDYQAHPHYNYHYGVHDLKTHDQKNQWEARDGHKTKGSYSLLQPDGRKRIVEYEADKDGVHYNVKYEGHAVHEEGHHGGNGGGGEGHGHGHSISHQYHNAESNYHGESHHGGDEGHHGGDEGHGSGGLGGYGGGHGHATSYATHVSHHGHHY